MHGQMEITWLYFPEMSGWSWQLQNPWSCQEKETGEKQSLYRLLTSPDVSPADVFDDEKKKSLEQKYVVLIVNIRISSHQN